MDHESSLEAIDAALLALKELRAVLCNARAGAVNAEMLLSYFDAAEAACLNAAEIVEAYLRPIGD